MLSVAVLSAAIRRAGAIRAVAPELRTPLLWLPLAVTGRLSLMLGRKLVGGTATEPVPGVEVQRREVVVTRPGVTPERTVPCYIYRPMGRTIGTLLWMHGGGLVMGSAEADHMVCSELARDANVVVVSVDYRLAPEHPLPAGLDDCVRVLSALLAGSLPSFDFRPGPLAVGGAREVVSLRRWRNVRMTKGLGR